MLKLEKPVWFHSEYERTMLDGLVGRIKNGRQHNKHPRTLSSKAKEILLPGWNTDSADTSILKKLLISEPKALKKLNDKLMKALSELPYLARPDKELLLDIFNYEGIFNDSGKKRAFWLAKNIGRNTCVYCNRQYIFTVEKGNGRSPSERIARPVFDHWFPRHKYPLLSISLYNLIPSCPVCNSSAKGSAVFDLNDFIHPYVHEKGKPNITFAAIPADGEMLQWTVNIQCPKDSKEENSVQAFFLREMYAMHGALEVSDIMSFKSAYPDGYLSDLFDKLLKDCVRPMTKQDVYRMLFGTEPEPDKFLDRPFSKLKHDLLKDWFDPL